ncbi:hypothetical protein BJ944DRAFT_267828 [Cunninghamella echinulata]|nr:hypothetical protein BJ944DRAFT_267828 [Cunninghamella echinulata]
MVSQGLKANPNYQFTLLVRNPDNIEYDEEEKTKLTLIKGDAEKKDDVLKAIEGSDVVVFSVGSTITATFKMTYPELCQRTIQVLIDAIQSIEDPSQRPKRLVAVTTTGAVEHKEVPLLFKPLYHLALHAPHEDKKEMEARIVKSCPIDWIIVRPSLLTNGELTGQYRSSDSTITGYTISRQDIGHFLLHQCLDDENAKQWIKKYAVVTY